MTDVIDDTGSQTAFIISADGADVELRVNVPHNMARGLLMIADLYGSTPSGVVQWALLAALSAWNREHGSKAPPDAFARTVINCARNLPDFVSDNSR